MYVCNFVGLGVGTFLKSKNPNVKVVLADPQVNWKKLHAY